MIKWLAISLCILLFACTSTKQTTTSLSLTAPINKNTLIQHVAFLADDAQQGRKTNTPSIQLSAKYIEDQLVKLNVVNLPETHGYQIPFSYRKGFKLKKGNNIVGFIEGSAYKTSFIILTAHYDHIGKKAGKIFNGADDNATGVAALLELAKVLQTEKPKHSIILLFTDSEEVNLNGARAFVEQFPKVIENTKLNINLDMLSGDKNTKSLHFINYGFDRILKSKQRIAFSALQHDSYVRIKKGFKSKALKGNNSARHWRIASDHGAFYKKRIPFIYFGVGEHTNYHTENDNVENLNQEFFWKASNAIYQQFQYLDQHI